MTILMKEKSRSNSNFSEYRDCLEKEKGSFLKNYKLDGIRRIKIGVTFMILFLSLLFIQFIPFILLAFIFGFKGLFHILLGTIYLVTHHDQKKDFEYLTTKGNLLLAEPIELLNSDYSMISSEYLDHLRIEATYIDENNQSHLFKSSPLWIYPIPYLGQNKVKVYFENDNMKRYVIDIDGSVNPEMRIPSEYLEKRKWKDLFL